MKVSDVSVALLNGYGNENSDYINHSSCDLEDERRKEKLKLRQIGTYRTEVPNRSLNSVNENAKAQVRITKAVKDATQDPQNNVSDVIKAMLFAVKEERKRSKILQKGGAGMKK